MTDELGNAPQREATDFVKNEERFTRKASPPQRTAPRGSIDITGLQRVG